MKVSQRKGIQLALLAIFSLLFFLGKVQLWMFVFLTGLLLSPIYGKIYCGYLCPMATVMEGITAAKRKFKLPALKTPHFLKQFWVRALLLALFFASFIFAQVQQVKLPILPLLFIAAILLTLVYQEKLWHRYLCPYGAILSLSGRWAKPGLTISKDACNGCSLCARQCPSDAIQRSDAVYHIDKKECLHCDQCLSICKRDAIQRS